MDLGIKKECGEVCAPCPPKEKEDELRYPGLTLEGEQVDRVKGDHECKVGDEYTATVKLRVTRISDDQFGKSLGFDVIEMDDFTPEGESADGDGDSGEYDGEAADSGESKSGKRYPKAIGKAMGQM